jgi:hypothetical protein
MTFFIFDRLCRLVETHVDPISGEVVEVSAEKANQARPGPRCPQSQQPRATIEAIPTALIVDINSHTPIPPTVTSAPRIARAILVIDRRDLSTLFVSL